MIPEAARPPVGSHPATSVATPRGSQWTLPLPRPVAYYLRHLLAGRFRLIPSDTAPPKLKGRALNLTRAQLTRIPESPQFQDTLARVERKITALKGWLHPGLPGAPILFLDGLGGWTLRLPKHGKSFQELRELRMAEQLRPVRSYEEPAMTGRPARRRHLIPLRYHPDAFLVVAILIYPSGHVGYETWVWHAARKVDIPLYWDEAQRCIDLFRDLTASWFWTHPAVGPAHPARPRGPTQGGSGLPQVPGGAVIQDEREAPAQSSGMS